MQLTVSLGTDDLTAMRFALSPLGETITALRLLQATEIHPVNRPWLRWARAELSRQPLALPRLWPLLPADAYRARPEFLTPAPSSRAPSLAEELARMRTTAPERIRGSLHRVLGDLGAWPDSARELAGQPERSMELIAAEITDAHNRLIEPHWERMRSVLDADIAYRGRVLAAAGARALFAGLNDGVHWLDGALTISMEWSGSDKPQVTPGPRHGLVLIPSVLSWPYTTVKLNASTQTTLRYPARGAAAIWEGMAPASDGVPDPGTAAPETALRALLGAPRARLLLTLRSPATTTGLARSLGVSPPAISQHLAVLRRSGLVTRARTGREVLYEVSGLGLGLLAGSASACGRWESEDAS